VTTPWYRVPNFKKNQMPVRFLTPCLYCLFPASLPTTQPATSVGDSIRLPQGYNSIRFDRSGRKHQRQVKLCPFTSTPSRFLRSGHYRSCLSLPLVGSRLGM
jgi:hypothetical protein